MNKHHKNSRENGENSMDMCEKKNYVVYVQYKFKMVQFELRIESAFNITIVIVKLNNC